MRSLIARLLAPRRDWHVVHVDSVPGRNGYYLGLGAVRFTEVFPTRQAADHFAAGYAHRGSRVETAEEHQKCPRP